jgi:hypothetical protein
MSSGLDVFSIIVRNALKTRDLPDRAQGRAADLPRPLGNGIRRGENVVALIRASDGRRGSAGQTYANRSSWS